MQQSFLWISRYFMHIRISSPKISGKQKIKKQDRQDLVSNWQITQRCRFTLSKLSCIGTRSYSSINIPLCCISIRYYDPDTSERLDEPRYKCDQLENWITMKAFRVFCLNCQKYIAKKLEEMK